MERKTGKLAALAALMGIGSQVNPNGVDLDAPPELPVVITAINPTQFGLYRANTKTHKRYLRSHNLGKFKKR